MDDKLLWVWLTERMHRSSRTITELMSIFDDVGEIYAKTDFKDIDFLTPAQRSALENKSLDEANKILEKIKMTGADILVYSSPDYPDMLRKTDEPPYVLYIKGEIMKWDRLMPIAVVGTRSCTDYGLNAAWAICTGLARSGITIVSGMARGLDSVAAAAAIKAGCKTIAVLGCGLDIVYPPENDRLMEAVTKHGAVITEYPPSTPPRGSHFPVRNRIISGLSRGTLVIQAPLHSGALITANYALDSGKDVFAVPGDINSPQSRGTNMLIKTGAKLVESSADILCEYRAEIELLKSEITRGKSADLDFEYEPAPSDNGGGGKNKTEKKSGAAKKKTVNNEKNISIDDERYSGLDDDEKSIIAQLIKSNMHIDDIKRNTDITIEKLTTKLTVLEMRGFIVQMPGKLFRINI
ncbi:MAG: DNA-processing protein DprA [Oscillospiraceae bacterium]|nr:DNA-processing protein DprA [Oscillospiraceae bacterium]